MKPRKLVWSAAAIADVEEICDFIALDKPAAALRWSSVLGAMAERAAAMPFAGRRVPEFERDDIREVIRRIHAESVERATPSSFAAFRIEPTSSTTARTSVWRITFQRSKGTT